MRKFYLENERGERINLNSPEHFLENPSGLGFNDTVTTLQSGNFFKTTNKTPAQTSFIGAISFVKNPYVNYQSFVDWIHSSNNITLIYAPYAIEYSRRVQIEYVEKTEISSGKLSCMFSALYLTPWFTKQKISGIFTNETVQNKKYGYKYAYKYTQYSANSIANIYLDAHIDGYIDFIANGALVSPTLELTDENGTTIGKMELDANISSDESLYYSSMPTECYLYKKQADGIIIDLKNNVDLNNNNWFSVPHHKNCVLKFSSGASTTDAEFTIYAFRVTV